MGGEGVNRTFTGLSKGRGKLSLTKREITYGEISELVHY